MDRGAQRPIARLGLDAEEHVLNKTAFWRHERWAVDVRDGLDGIALAFATDAWSRTGRVSVDASAPGHVKLRSGLVLVAPPAAQGTPRLPLDPQLKPAQKLDRTLCGIAERFGTERRDWVLMELEYPGATTECVRGSGTARHGRFGTKIARSTG